jgi:two-component system, NtrC family, sensor kinase
MGRTINSAGKTGKRRPLKGTTAKLRRRTRGHGSSGVAQEPESARLNRELDDALQRQSATAEILKVIASSRSDVRPVFETIAASANRLIGGFSTAVYRFAGGMAHLAAFTPTTPAADEILKRAFPRPTAGLPQFERVQAGKMFEIPNVDETLKVELRKIARARGVRSVLGVPLVNNGTTMGLITVTRKETGSFADHHVRLLQMFADQAVIAIENVRLFEDLQGRTRDLAESVEQQTATSEVLQVISSSPGELEPVFESMLMNATRICGANFGTMNLCEEGTFRAVAHYNVPAAYAASLAQTPFQPHPQSGLGTVAETHQVVHIEDIRTLPPYLEGDPSVVKIADLAGARTYFVVPMLKENELIGAITIFRQEVKPFAVKQIELVANFAKQAVIAIENTRLLRELRESLQQQTATADVLKVIASSPTDVKPVLKAIVESACELCEANDALVALKDGDDLVFQTQKGSIPVAWERRPINRGWISGRAVADCTSVHVHDVRAPEGEEFPDARELSRRDSTRTLLAAPLLREGESIGAIVLRRTKVQPFNDKQIALLQTFANQAVIAIGNVRLFDEVRARTRDLEQSLEQQTATADVLKVISHSTVDLETVLDTLVETVARLCRTDQTLMFRRHDDKYHLVAACGLSAEAKVFIHTHPLTLDRGSVSGRVALDRRAVHIPDVLQDPEYTYSEGQKVSGARTILGVPLLREDALVGIFTVHRTRVDPFTDKEIELVTTFADQAVIAIENARLFEELHERQAELRVTFDSMGDGVVMFGADARLVAWNRNFQEMLDLPDAFLGRRPSYAEYFRYLAERGEFVSADIEADLRRLNEDPWQALRLERTRPDGRVIEVRRNSVPGGGFVLIYGDITERKRAEEAIRAARDAAEIALHELQTAQRSLVHAQKMAALGQVTAGIAHEIKNPLNFVNNFAGLSVELLDELKDAAARSVGAPDPGKRAEIAEIIGMLTGNLEKIVEHGRRADGIVRSMLQHSRGSSDDWQSTDLNALAEEALNLAYHGARAQDPNFDIALERDLDPNLAPVDVVPQELTRVLLNLIGNGFYAAAKRSLGGDGTFRPALKVTTREFGESVEVLVRDNGIGILPENRDKLFQPFFTTKPTGEGTGLGLSISYEIVTQQHGGTITVESEVGDFTEFTVRLPRRGRALAI